MDSSAAVEKVREKLESSFGKALAMMIMASASNQAGVPTIGMSRGQFLALVEALARDQRVVDMWGASGASDALAQWRQLAETVSV